MNGQHRWVDPVKFELVDRDARYVARRNHLQVYRNAPLRRLGPSYCACCRVPYSPDVDSCAADTDRESIIGGDPSSRKKRKVVTPVGPVVSGEPLVRRVHDLPYSPRGSRAARRNGALAVTAANLRSETHGAHAWVLDAVAENDRQVVGTSGQENVDLVPLDVLGIICMNCGTDQVFRRQVCISVPPRSPMGRHLARLRCSPTLNEGALVGLPSALAASQKETLRASC
jgi:hypothetical protein